MEYYSRNPEEMNKRSLAEKSSNRNRRLISQFILFIDIILVIGILFYYQNVADTDKKTIKALEKKIIHWNGWEIISDCSKNKCDLMLIQKENKAKAIKIVTWEKVDSLGQTEMRETFSYKKGSSISVKRPKKSEKLFFEIFQSKENSFRFRAWP